MKTLSIVLPNYNHAQFLEYSMPVIFNQKRLPDEIIILDDASTDNSMDVLKKYQSKYNSIRLYENEKILV